MNKKTRVVQYGLGSIGQEAARSVLKKEKLKLVGAIDSDPEKVGKDVGELLNLGRSLGVIISAVAETVLQSAKADVVLHTTTSQMKDVCPQIMALIDAGVNVISSTEELFYPKLRNPERAQEINRKARERGITVLGTGVNPGFLMDSLVVALTGVCLEVRKVQATRIVDVASRRLPLQRKMGVGLTQEAFRQKAQEGKLGHVGLAESLAWMAKTLGWKLDDVRETLEPVLAEVPLETESARVEKGRVAGARQVLQGLIERREIIVLGLEMSAGVKEPRDSILIDGTPPVDLIIRGGVQGDEATVALLVNSIPRVLEAGPGLLSAGELPLPRIFN